MPKFTIRDLQEQYPSDDVCLEVLLNAQNHICKCGRTEFYRIKNRRAFACPCGKHIYPLQGTIFAGSQTPLTTWFLAIYLMSVTKCGISAAQMSRMTGVTYKCAWRMMHKIREKMAADFDFAEDAHVEIDETYFKAKSWRNNRPFAWKSQRANVVLGMVERDGRARAFHIPTNSARIMLPIIRKHVPQTTTIYTDFNYSYYALDDSHLHRPVNHSKQYVRDDYVYTNTVEGLFSHMKRGVQGVYRLVSPQHLQKYLNEFTWRYSHRNSDNMFDDLLKAIIY